MQDGAPAHTACVVREWLVERFGSRVISRLCETEWPASSPDLALNDFWLWGAILQEIRKIKPTTMDQVKEVATEFCERLQPAEVFKATAHIRTRCRANLDCGDGHFKHFEHLLKSKKKNYCEE